MASRLIIDGNSVYEIDEDCEKGWQITEPKRSKIMGNQQRNPENRTAGRERKRNGF